MPSFDSILFDFDGVLADTEPVHCACWAEVLATVGVTLTWEFYRRQCIGIDDRDMLRLLATQSGPPRDWDDTPTPTPRGPSAEKPAAPLVSPAGQH